MEILIALLALAVPCVWTWAFVTEILRVKWARQLAHTLKIEQNRNRFGARRTELVSLARAGGIDPSGRMFRAIYGALTVLLRSPYDYSQAARLIMSMSRTPPSDDEPLTDDQKLIVKGFAEDIDLLCRDFSIIYRVFAWAIDRLQRAKTTPFWIQLFASRKPEPSLLEQALDERATELETRIEELEARAREQRARMERLIETSLEEKLESKGDSGTLSLTRARRFLRDATSDSVDSSTPLPN